MTIASKECGVRQVTISVPLIFVKEKSFDLEKLSQLVVAHNLFSGLDKFGSNHF